MAGKSRSDVDYGLGEHKIDIAEVFDLAALARNIEGKKLKANPFRDFFESVAIDTRRVLDAASQTHRLQRGSVLTNRAADGSFSLWTSVDQRPFKVRLFEFNRDGSPNMDRPIGDRVLHHVGIQSWFGTQGIGLDLSPSVAVVLMEDSNVRRYPGMTHFFDPERPDDGLPYLEVDKLFGNATRGFAEIIRAENPVLLQALASRSKEDRKERKGLPVIHGFPETLISSWKRVPGAAVIESVSSGQVVTPGTFKDQIPGNMALFLEGASAVHRQTYLDTIGKKEAALQLLINIALDGYDAGEEGVLSPEAIERSTLARSQRGEAVTFYEMLARGKTSSRDSYPVFAYLNPGGSALAVPRQLERPRVDYPLNQLLLSGMARKAGRATAAAAELNAK